MENQGNQTIRDLLSSQGSEGNQVISRMLIKQSDTPPHPLDDTSLSYNNALSFLGDQSFDGLCERFAEQETYGKSGIFSSAADAWNNYTKTGQAIHGNSILAPKGSLIYFKPDHSNYGDGHVAISDGQGNMISATSNGVKQMPILDWMNKTGQKPEGFVTP